MKKWKISLRVTSFFLCLLVCFGLTSAYSLTSVKAEETTAPEDSLNAYHVVKGTSFNACTAWVGVSQQAVRVYDGSEDLYVYLVHSTKLASKMDLLYVCSRSQNARYRLSVPNGTSLNDVSTNKVGYYTTEKSLDASHVGWYYNVHAFRSFADTEIYNAGYEVNCPSFNSSATSEAQLYKDGNRYIQGGGVIDLNDWCDSDAIYKGGIRIAPNSTLRCDVDGCVSITNPTPYEVYAFAITSPNRTDSPYGSLLVLYTFDDISKQQSYSQLYSSLGQCNYFSKKSYSDYDFEFQWSWVRFTSLDYVNKFHHLIPFYSMPSFNWNDLALDSNVKGYMSFVNSEHECLNEFSASNKSYKLGEYDNKVIKEVEDMKDLGTLTQIKHRSTVDNVMGTTSSVYREHFWWGSETTENYELQEGDTINIRFDVTYDGYTDQVYYDASATDFEFSEYRHKIITDAPNVVAYFKDNASAWDKLLNTFQYPRFEIKAYLQLVTSDGRKSYWTRVNCTYDTSNSTDGYEDDADSGYFDGDDNFIVDNDLNQHIDNGSGMHHSDGSVTDDKLIITDEGVVIGPNEEGGITIDGDGVHVGTEGMAQEIQSLIGLVGQTPQTLALLLSWLPSWVTKFLAVCIAIWGILLIRKAIMG